MIAQTPQQVVAGLIERGLDRPMARTVRRELRKARADGILRGVCAMLRPDDVCVDCGANKGEVTEILAETGATVHGFEPDPDIFAELHASYGAQDNVVLHEAAVGPKAGTATFYRSKVSKHHAAKGATGGTLVADNAVADAEQATEVQVADFPAFLSGLIDRHGRVAFLKVDIEGAEIALLDALLAADLLPKVGLTVVETHRWLLPDRAGDYDRLHHLAETRPELNLYLGWI